MSSSTTALVRAANARASNTATTYETTQKLYGSAKEFWEKRFAYTVTISEKDMLYPDVHIWLMTIIPDTKNRALMVMTETNRYNVVESPDSDRSESKPLTIRYNDRKKRTVIVDGHRVSVELLVPDLNEHVKFEPEPSRIRFTTRTFAAQQAVLAHLQRINDARATTRKAVLRMVNQWGSWRTRSDLPPRTLESVSLPKDQTARVVNDLQNFLDSEDHYNRLAIAWHRGYMFHGPPGTGKTSFIKALANHFNLDLWYISLSDLKAESSLLGLLSEVNPRSILLLEDIDTMRITHDRDGSEQGTISMSSLLNTLDGVATPHGLITVMTTNRFEMLDHALTRAGRMDVIEELGYPTMVTLASMFQHFYGRLPSWCSNHWNKPLNNLSTAQVAEVFKHHMRDPEGAEKAAYALIEEAINHGR